MRMSLLPRWMHQLYAFVFRYFWGPCSRCGRMMGGHEWDGTTIPLVDGTNGGICKLCIPAVDEEVQQEIRRRLDDINIPIPEGARIIDFHISDDGLYGFVECVEYERDMP